MNNEANGGLHGLDNEPLYDLTLIEAAGKSDMDFLSRTIDMIIQIMPHDLEELKLVAVAGDIRSVGKAAHKMKSSIGLLGITSLTETIKQLEFIDESDPHLLESLVSRMDLVIMKVVAQLEELRRQYYP